VEIRQHSHEDENDNAESANGEKNGTFHSRGKEETSGASLPGRKHRAGFLDPASVCLRLFG
jgi:hypothetical protein